jgi:hypothetical protein
MKTSKPPGYGFGAISGYPTLDAESQRKLQEGINVLAKMIAQAIWNYAPGENNLPSGADKLSGTGNQNGSEPIQVVPKKLALSPAETASLLGMRVNMDYKLVRENNIPHVRYWRRILIPCMSLRKMIDE